MYNWFRLNLGKISEVLVFGHFCLHMKSYEVIWSMYFCLLLQMSIKPVKKYHMKQRVAFIKSSLLCNQMKKRTCLPYQMSIDKHERNVKVKGLTLQFSVSLFSVVRNTSNPFIRWYKPNFLLSPFYININQIFILITF